MDLESLILGYSAKYQLDPGLVASIIWQESKGQVWTIRYEPRFYDKLISFLLRPAMSGYVPDFPPTLVTEKRARAFSWGVMQVMGETARVMGFRGQFLSELLDVRVNLDIGCKYLKHCFKLAETAKAKGVFDASVVEGALKFWNNSWKYPPLVLEHYRTKAYLEMYDGRDLG